MKRGTRLQRKKNDALFAEACRKAATAFAGNLLRDALGAYERFKAAHPKVHAEDIDFRIKALKEYIDDPASNYATKPA